MNPIKIVQRDPADLAGHFHPLLKTIPPLAQTGEEFRAIKMGMKECGILSPLLIDSQNRILDDHSRTLLQCAQVWQLKAVPVQVCNDEDAALVAVHSLLHRRHLTKSALAYLAAPLLEVAFKAARQKRLKNLANHDSALSALSTEPLKTVDEMAEEFGLSRRFLFEAKEVHKRFEDPRKYRFNMVGGSRDGEMVEMTLKEWFEPRILRSPIGGEHEQNRPLGLGAVIAGIASVKENKREMFDPRSCDQLELFKSGLGQFVGRALRLAPADMRKEIRAWLEAKEGQFEDEQFEQLVELGETLKVEARHQLKARRLAAPVANTTESI